MAKYGSKGYVEELINKPPSYTDSADTLAAKDKVTEYEGKIPTEPYKGTYTEQVDGMVKSYLGRDKFNYNPNNDATYQQLRDTYLNTGKKAMQDTLGSGAMLSGGNNNSAAQIAAQQVYNDYAKRVSDSIPTLEAQAYSRHRAENADKLQDLNLLVSLDDKEYARNQDEVNKIMGLLNYYGGKYQSSVAKDQSQYGNDLNIWGQRLSAGQSEVQSTKSDVMNLLLSGIDVEDSVLESVGIKRNTANEIIKAAKAASVSSGGGSGTKAKSYSKTSINQMLEDKDYDGLMNALLSMGGDVYENAQSYGISKHMIDYINDGFVSREQVDWLLKNYGVDNIPETVNAFNADAEDYWYAVGNTMSQYDTYSDYLKALYGKYINI